MLWRCLESTLDVENHEIDGYLTLLYSLGSLIRTLESDEGETLAALFAIAELLHGDLNLYNFSEAQHGLPDVFLGDVIGKAA